MSARCAFDIDEFVDIGCRIAVDIAAKIDELSSIRCRNALSGSRISENIDKNDIESISNHYWVSKVREVLGCRVHEGSVTCCSVVLIPVSH